MRPATRAMFRMSTVLVAAFFLSILPSSTQAARFHNSSSIDRRSYLPRSQSLLAYDDRPPECPPCFNCQLDKFPCRHFSECNPYTGTCICPPGFGGDDCAEPVCGALSDGVNRPIRKEKQRCKCKDGWDGINCNVCNTDAACDTLMPNKEGGVCYKDGVLAKENHQMCEVTNKKIVSLLSPRKPQVTFSCEKEDATCNFQFWIDHVESFYCSLDSCSFDFEPESNRNTTNYRCNNVNCACVPGRTLCGENGSVDITEFLETVTGPATFSTLKTRDGSSNDGSLFSEPTMNSFIQAVFGDKSISLNCHSGECLYKTDVPGFKVPVKTINTPLIAGIIASVALLVVALSMALWYASRRPVSSGYGAIALSDEPEDENGSLISNHEPAALHFENVSYALNGKPILSDIQGSVPPGQVMAILGASGAGKTTFLDILARKNKRGSVQGNFYVNGEPIGNEKYRRLVGFVDQEDTMLPTLTVHETILTSALLRLPKDMQRVIKEQRVMEVEKQLGIFHIRDQIVGSEEGNGRGISGGEKRRVGIACELVTSPSLLFLDEPTSGLDAYNAYNVIECLVNLAKNYNRTIIFTIHQPRSNIVALFDRLVLLAKGYAVYSGPLASCQPYFDEIGFPCPTGYNIADYLVDLTMHASQSASHNGETFTERVSRIGPTQAEVPATASVTPNQNEVDPETLHRSSARHRALSLRQQQERQLFTRRRPASIVVPDDRTDEEDVPTPPADNQPWLPIHRFQQRPTNEEHDGELPPTAPNASSELDILIFSHKISNVASAIREEIQTAVRNAAAANNANGRVPTSGISGDNGNREDHVYQSRRIGWLTQFIILSQRTWRNIYRNPLLMLMHYAVAVVLAVLSGYLFYGLTDDIKGFQNRLGLFFFLLALFGFSTLSSLNVFSSERLLFMRERANGYYSPITYFAAKVVFDIIPLRLIPPILMGVIVYPMVGLIPEWPEFLRFLLIMVLFNMAAAAISLFIGIIFRESSVANLIGSLVMLFSLLFAGLLLNHDAIPKEALWLQRLSIFHYGFEGLIVNEVTYLTLIDRKYGLDIQVPGASILTAFGFDTAALWLDIAGLAVFAASFIVIAYLAMHFLLLEKR